MASPTLDDDLEIFSQPRARVAQPPFPGAPFDPQATLGLIEFLDDLPPRKKRDWEGIKQRLVAGADPNAIVEGVTRALQWAIDEEQPKLCQWLLDAGADPELTRGTDYPLRSAAYCGSETFIQMLLSVGAAVDGPSTTHLATPLMAAACMSQHGAMRLLIAAGADLERQNCEGDRALGFAASHGDPDALLLLIQAGANTQAINKEGKNAATLAEQAKNHECSKILKAFAEAQELADCARKPHASAAQPRPKAL